jgi:serine O-acetyltransferase
VPFSVLRLHRVAHSLDKRGLHQLARLVQGLIYVVFSAVIPPEVSFGERVNLMHHGFGIVMHPNVVVGDDVIVYHHVTLGTDTRRDDPRRLVIGRGAVIGAGAVVLGPIDIGEGARVGAGAVVTKDVPAGAVVVGNPARVVGAERDQRPDDVGRGPESSSIARNE